MEYQTQIEKMKTVHEKCAFAIARSLKALNVEIVTNVPGSGSEKILANYNEIADTSLPISFHEEVAYSVAHAASLMGKRSACLIKSHGLVKAGNSVMDALSCSVNAGMVTFVFSDKEGSHSDNIFNVEPFMKGLELPYFYLKKDNVFQDIQAAYEFSERWQLPVGLLVDDRILEELIELTFELEKEPTTQFERNITQNLVCPVFGKYQYEVFQTKLNGRDWRSIEAPNAPSVNGNLPQEWRPTIEIYRPVFDVFKMIRGGIVFGDTGISSLFAFEPYNCIDITAYMGGSVPMAVGAYLSGHEDVWAVTGDFAFISTGYLGLIEAKMRNIPLKVLIFKNDSAQTTGGQSINPDLLRIQLKGFESNTSYIKIDNQLRDNLEKAHASEKMEIIVIEC